MPIKPRYTKLVLDKLASKNFNSFVGKNIKHSNMFESKSQHSLLQP